MLNRTTQFFSKLSLPRLMLLSILIALPAFLINLGISAFTGDEAIRALVALEMHLSGNYIATTMHGADYINKPPLFNWFVLAVSRAWGSFGEWPSRLTTLYFLGLFAWIHFKVLRPHFGKEKAFLGALMLVSSGRLLFYDAMLGLIDTAFSCTVYALMLSWFHFGKQERWQAAFVWSYFLMAVAFMFKGFPAIVFQGFSLVAALFFFRRWRLLFSWQHLVGAAAAAGLIALYLLVLSRYRDLDVYLNNLIHESTKRTVIAFGWGKFWSHLVKFPLESVYHFLPWSLLIVLWFDRRFVRKITANDFALFNLLLMAVNLPVYWTSIQVQPRYLLMFIPLFNTIGLYLLDQADLQKRIFYVLLLVLMAVGAAGMLALPFVKAVAYLPGIRWISLGLFLGMALLIWLYVRVKERYLWWFAWSLLWVRIGFDLIVLPARRDESIVTRARNDVRELAGKYREYSWYVYGDAYIREPASFYATQYFGKIIPRTTDTTGNRGIFLVNPDVYPDFRGHCVDTLQTDYPEMQHLLFLFRPLANDTIPENGQRPPAN